jgi:PAS domain S-box-containing protein
LILRRTQAFAELRARARALVAQGAAPRGVPLDEVHTLVQELSIHQAELELQQEELERAHVELELSRRRYRELFEHTPVATFVLDAHGFVREANNAAFALLGASKVDVVGRPLLLLVSYEDREQFLRHRNAARAGAARPIEISLLTRRGHACAVQMETFALAGVPGVEASLLTTAVDVSRRVSAEAHLRVAKERLVAVIDAAPLAILAFDERGAVASYNAAAARMLEWPAHAMLGRALHDTCARLPALPELVERARSGERLDAVEVTMESPAGQRMLLAYGGATHRGDGTGDGAVLVLADVTEREHLERQLWHAQKLDAIGQVAGGLAHDFNNVLTVVLSGAGTLARRLDDGPLRREAEGIARAAAHAAQLARQLLTFSRRTEGMAPGVPLDAGLREIERLLRMALPETIRLVLELGAPTAHIQLDVERLSQIVLNLAVNARDAMPDGGSLTIRTDLDPADGMVRLDVADTGCGMSPEVQARVFEPFFTTKPPSRGSGLGLATVSGIVQSVGGDVRLASTVGEGTTFTLRFPEIEAPRAPVDMPQPDASPLEGRETVLLVEDEPLVREAAAIALSEYGYEVLAADGIAEARELAAERRGDIRVLVTDMVMPDAGGLAVARAVLDFCPDIRVIVMSGYVPETLVPDGEMPDGFIVLQKPFSAELLARAVRSCLA